jgi:hypothetical protein
MRPIPQERVFALYTENVSGGMRLVKLKRIHIG